VVAQLAAFAAAIKAQHLWPPRKKRQETESRLVIMAMLTRLQENSPG